MFSMIIYHSHQIQVVIKLCSMPFLLNSIQPLMAFYMSATLFYSYNFNQKIFHSLGFSHFCALIYVHILIFFLFSKPVIKKEIYILSIIILIWSVQTLADQMNAPRRKRVVHDSFYVSALSQILDSLQPLVTECNMLLRVLRSAFILPNGLLQHVCNMIAKCTSDQS